MAPFVLCVFSSKPAFSRLGNHSVLFYVSYGDVRRLQFQQLDPACSMNYVNVFDANRRLVVLDFNFNFFLVKVKLEVNHPSMG